MLCADFKKHTLQFISPGGTSRGVLTTKDSWYLRVWQKDRPNILGVGECSILPNLSIDDRSGYETKLNEVCHQVNKYSKNFHETLLSWPSIRFGLEMALLDLKNGGERIYFPSGFTESAKAIPINGLIWMGKIDYMKKQLHEKLKSGFNCIKIKIGALEFEKEIALIKGIRDNFSADELEIRVDANGAFSVDEAQGKLERLNEFKIHSIEQPIKQQQRSQMAKLCQNSPLDIALDEELIGVNALTEKQALISEIKPKYIILKPSLLGGFKASEEWIQVAEEHGVKWWATSALEGNIGLNAIAQWTAIQDNSMPQGLGTGKVFSNNIDSPLDMDGGHLVYSKHKLWGRV
ncbi:o-succinylbenzoate synthase [Labilibacter sediminis]|nr:o-succinylbenzoate synthase [Labilibacter sediminis]